MTKYTVLVLLFLVSLLIISICGDTVPGQQTQQQQRPQRSRKVTSVKKKKLIPTLTTASPPPILETTLPLINEEDEQSEITTNPNNGNEEQSSTHTPPIILISTTGTPRVTKKIDFSSLPEDESEDEDEEEEVKQVPKKLVITPHKKIRKPVPVMTKAAMGCEDECDKEECGNPTVTNCPTGLVIDWCNCCTVCSVGEGNRCYDPALKLSYNPDIGICGPGLVCKLRTDLELFDTPEALCECRDRRIVCGSDNRTYSSECKLKAEAAQSNNSQLVVASWKPCVSAPWISTDVENVTVTVGQEIALSCEIKGYPPPIVHWEFIQNLNDKKSPPTILPGDDSSVVVVVRGGPEAMMTTTWIQIIGVSPQRQGKYFCMARNSEGLAQSSAVVTVQE